MKYEIIENMPVAKFWYKGTHTHPVRRTILIVEENENFIRGYELREGRIIRKANESPIKTYRYDRIAKGNSLRKNSPIRILYPNKSTLTRKPLIDIIKTGV